MELILLVECFIFLYVLLYRVSAVHYLRSIFVSSETLLVSFKT